MPGIYTMESEQIIDHIQELKPAYKSKKVNHELLDGTFIQQTIGSPFRVLELEIYGNTAAMERINYAAAIGEQLKFESNTKYYNGYIEAQPTWSYSAVDYYNASLTVLVAGEGDL